MTCLKVSCKRVHDNNINSYNFSTPAFILSMTFINGLHNTVAIRERWIKLQKLNPDWEYMHVLADPVFIAKLQYHSKYCFYEWKVFCIITCDIADYKGFGVMPMFTRINTPKFVFNCHALGSFLKFILFTLLWFILYTVVMFKTEAILLSSDLKNSYDKFRSFLIL